MYKWVVKLNLLIDDYDEIITPDLIKLRYVINADSFTQALAEAYNDMVSSETIGCTGRVTNCVVRQIGRN